MTESFDRFADWVAEKVASAYFFAACVVLVLIWAPSYFLIRNLDTWQLIINTGTTIVTFLMVALLQNDTHRFEKAVNERLQTIIDALEAAEDPVQDEGQKPL